MNSYIENLQLLSKLLDSLIAQQEANKNIIECGMEIEKTIKGFEAYAENKYKNKHKKKNRTT